MNKHKKIWHADIFNLHENEFKDWEGAMGGLVWPGDIVKSNPDFEPMTYATLFTYMVRRFGYPEYGSDPDKEIANWYLTTPNPKVGLIVSPRPAGICLSFGYWRERSLKDRGVVMDALSSAIYDLLSPVYVRDVPIDACGRVNYPNDLLEHFCDYSEFAGIGVERTYYGQFK